MESHTFPPDVKTPLAILFLNKPLHLYHQQTPTVVLNLDLQGDLLVSVLMLHWMALIFLYTNATPKIILLYQQYRIFSANLTPVWNPIHCVRGLKKRNSISTETQKTTTYSYCGNNYICMDFPKHEYVRSCLDTNYDRMSTDFVQW